MYLHEYLTAEKRKELGVDRLIGTALLCLTPRLGNVTVEQFKLMKDADFYYIDSVGESKKRALIWVRNYLNGEVTGTYEKETPDNIEIIKLRETIKKHTEKERALSEKIKELNQINSDLRKELNNYKIMENKYQKAKEIILSI